MLVLAAVLTLSISDGFNPPKNRMMKPFLRSQIFVLSVCFLPTLAFAQSTDSVEVSFVLFEGARLNLATDSADPTNAPMPVAPVLLPDPENPAQQLLLASMQLTEFTSQAVVEGTMAFALLHQGQSRIERIAVRPDTKQLIVVLLRDGHGGFRPYVLGLASRVQPGDVLLQNFAQAPVAIQISEQNIPLKPGELKIHPIANANQASLKVAVKYQEGGRWRYIYASALGGDPEQALLLLIYPSTGSQRVGRVKIPLAE